MCICVCDWSSLSGIYGTFDTRVDPFLISILVHDKIILSNNYVMKQIIRMAKKTEEERIFLY